MRQWRDGRRADAVPRRHRRQRLGRPPPGAAQRRRARPGSDRRDLRSAHRGRRAHVPGGPRSHGRRCGGQPDVGQDQRRTRRRGGNEPASSPPRWRGRRRRTSRRGRRDDLGCDHAVRRRSGLRRRRDSGVVRRQNTGTTTAPAGALQDRVTVVDPNGSEVLGNNFWNEEDVPPGESYTPQLHSGHARALGGLQGPRRAAIGQGRDLRLHVQSHRCMDGVRRAVRPTTPAAGGSSTPPATTGTPRRRRGRSPIRSGPRHERKRATRALADRRRRRAARRHLQPADHHDRWALGRLLPGERHPRRRHGRRGYHGLRNRGFARRRRTGAVNRRERTTSSRQGWRSTIPCVRLAATGMSLQDLTRDWRSVGRLHDGDRRRTSRSQARPASPRGSPTSEPISIADSAQDSVRTELIARQTRKLAEGPRACSQGEGVDARGLRGGRRLFGGRGRVVVGGGQRPGDEGDAAGNHSSAGEQGTTGVGAHDGLLSTRPGGSGPAMRLTSGQHGLAPA